MEYLSKKRYDEIAAELNHLITVVYPEVREQVAETSAQGDRSDDEEKQAEVHGVLAVIAGSADIDVFREDGHHNQGINAEGNDAQQDGLEPATLGGQLNSGSSIDVFHKKTSFLLFGKDSHNPIIEDRRGVVNRFVNDF